jgi:hypothetical protein
VSSPEYWWTMTRRNVEAALNVGVTTFEAFPVMFFAWNVSTWSVVPLLPFEDATRV